MRLTVPYIVLAHCEEDGDFRLLAETHIDIPEISEGEAPKVARYCDLTGRDLVMRATRIHQGRFFAPSIAESGKPTPLNYAAIKKSVSGGRPPKDLIHYIELNGGHGPGNIGEAMRIDLAGWYKGDESKFFRDARSVGPYEPFNDERRQDIVSAARGLLLIDGWLHYEQREPYIAVTPIGTTLIRNNFDLRNDSCNFAGDVARFGLYEADQAEEFATREFPERGPASNQYDRLSVADEAAFPFDAISDLSIRIGQQLINDSRHQIHQMHPNQIRCWLDLRGETETARAGDRDPRKLLELITEFVDRGLSNAARPDRDIGWLKQMIEETGRHLPLPGFHTLP
jgi:hypothetical protein